MLDFKVKSTLAEALVRSGLRKQAGKRLDKHGMADYGECAVFDAWVGKAVTLKQIDKVKKILVTVDAIVERDGKILLIRRKNEPFKGYYALPGGFLEYGESAEEAVKREVREEANLDIKIKRLLGVYSAFGRDPRWHVISICYVAQGQGKERGGSDAKDARFFGLEELKKEKLAFDHSKIIEDYKKGK